MDFLESTVKYIQNEHTILINTPRARASRSLKDEIKEFVGYCDWLLRGGELDESYYKKIIKEINKLDFDNLAEQRRMLKRKKDNKGGTFEHYQ